MTLDLIIRNGRVFDGKGGEGHVADIGIADGIVQVISEEPIPAGSATTVVDASGRWVTPGFVDMHTHYDAEVEIAPELIESLRHGVTTAVMGSCSLSMAVGDPVDLADMFCRVEAIPRETVLPLLEQIKTWNSPREYLEHLHGQSLGPNVACMLGHSTIRAAAMGMERALDKRARPTRAELGQMDAWLSEALDAGYIGLSISTLPWDKMDGDEFRSRPMPSVFATWREYRHFFKTLRARDRVLQAVPNISTKLNVPLFLMASAGVLRKPLKTTIISMMDIRADRYAFRLAGVMSRLFNRFLGADFRMQALPELFDLWADGIDLVVFEEFESGTAALHLQDAMTRSELLRDPAYRKRFKKQWRRKWMPRAYHRNFRHSQILKCPDASVIGRSFDELARERGQDVEDVYLDLVAEHGQKLRWYTVMGNDRPDWLKWIVSHEDILIGFSDAGAHLRNMAHYNFPMRLLKMVRDAEQAGAPFMSTGRAVQRLTSEIADWLGLDVGTLEVGRRADAVVINPDALTDQVETVHEAPMPGFDGLQRLVRRNDDAVETVVVGGQIAVERGELVRRGTGAVLEAGSAARKTKRPQHHAAAA